MDEFELIEAIRARFTRDASSLAPLIDLGDDAAVLRGDARPSVLSVDASVEGVHFERSFAPPEDLGYRALMAAASDLAAMAAEPEAALLALTIAPGTDDAWLLALVDGYAEAATACGLRVVGGNVSRGAQASLTTTVTGRVPHGAIPLSRAGARVGDDVYVSGRVGLAALGLAVIRSGSPPRSAAAHEAQAHWRRPRARIALGAALRPYVSSAVDLSDGLLQDAAHVARASGVGFELMLTALPTVAGFHAACEALELPGDATALHGGEDYELLFTAPPAHRGAIASLGADVTRIGCVWSAPEVLVVCRDGKPRALGEHAGFRHRW